MKILSVDYGDARTGLAACDKTEFLVSPLGVLKETSLAKTAEKIIYTVRDIEAGMVIVGLPKKADGSETARTDKSRKLAQMLKSVLGLPVELQDERFSTKDAQDILEKNGVTGKKQKELIDTVAACVILERFLEKRNAQRKE